MDASKKQPKIYSIFNPRVTFKKKLNNSLKIFLVLCFKPNVLENTEYMQLQFPNQGFKYVMLKNNKT